MPESSVKDLNEAKVLAVGPGMLNKDGKRIEMSVKEGDKVLIPQVSDPPNPPITDILGLNGAIADECPAVWW